MSFFATVGTAVQKNVDLIGSTTSITLAGISFTDINQIAQAFAAISAGIVAWATLYYRIREHRKSRNKPKDD